MVNQILNLSFDNDAVTSHLIFSVIKGCKPGYFGKFCNSACPLGAFGENCGGKCTCRDEECDRVLGCPKIAEKIGKVTLRGKILSHTRTSFLDHTD